MTGSDLVTPAGLADLLPSRPVLASQPESWRGVVLQRYRHPPGTIDVPGLRDALLVDHLVGPVLVEDAYGDGWREQRWTGPGQVTVTPAGQPVHRILKGRPDVVLVHLEQHLLNAVAEEVYGIDPTRLVLVRRLAVPDDTADRLVRLLLAEAAAPGPGTPLMSETLSRALALQLLRAHSNLSPHPPEAPARLAGPRIRRVIEQMRSRLEEDLTLERLAQIGGLSPSRFARAFRGATGQSPHRYLVGLRIERARELLERTSLPVIEIGLRCGFEQPSHFATTFRRMTGLSPRTWRQARQG